MRLIDADELKEAFSCCATLGGLLGEAIDKIVAWAIKIIDDAPTIEPKPSSCDLMEFGKCSYKETGCSDCRIKSNLRYMCHGSAWQELQALREFKEKHEKKGKWLHENDDHYDWYVCSHCGYGDEGEVTDTLSAYCPNCGADMRGEI